MARSQRGRQAGAVGALTGLLSPQTTGAPSAWSFWLCFQLALRLYRDALVTGGREHRADDGCSGPDVCVPAKFMR